MKDFNKMAFFDKTKQFISEVKVELGKVNWPDRKSVYGSTSVVVATTAVMTIFLWSMDLIFSFLLGIMFR
jgi:preprotein translocase subunit SecE